MAVKDLVGLFESQAGPPHTTSRASGSRHNPRPHASQLPPEIPSPKPIRAHARFLRHPLLNIRDPYDDTHLPDTFEGLPSTSDSPLTTSNDNFTTPTQTETITTIHDTTQRDVVPPSRVHPAATSELPIDVSPSHMPSRRLNATFEPQEVQTHEPKSKVLPARPNEHEYEMEKLLPNSGFSTGANAPRTPPGTLRSRSPFKLPADSDSASVASTSTVVHEKAFSLGPHTPIPATTIFSRDAAPLYIPHLDEYISTIPAPSFPSLPLVSQYPGKGKGKEKASGSGMFPPMDKLAATGKTLDDLEHNSEVAPGWRNRDTIFGILTSAALGLTGSSALASFYSLHGIFDTIQIFALVLNTIGHSGNQTDDQWRKLLLGKIPNILALNLATSTVISLVLLIVFMLLSGVLLFFFYRATSICAQLGQEEGLRERSSIKNTWSIVLISFTLTVLYLPLSTMALHVLVWSEDLWVVPNPYINATSLPPQLPPLGPPDQFRDPLDFCWTTSMRKDQVNFSPIVIIIAAACIAGITIWFPIHLRRTIRVMCPKVDRFTELGQPRSSSDMDREYQRLLARDRNPLSFLYGDFRRGWATWESITLMAKLTALTLTAFIDPDNCLFRTVPRTTVAVVRQILLLIAMLAFFLVQCFFAPFLDPVNNASEWTSRLNYVLTSAVSLAIAANTPGKEIFNGPVLYIIYILTYGLTLYFALINASFMRRFVKRLARRIDFSIDIFSPRIDLSPSSPHAKRRIWQEAITTLLLTDPRCAIPKSQLMDFAQARDTEYPPYLLGFSGTPGERHVENLKILRETGSLAYRQAVIIMTGSDNSWFQYVQHTIQTRYIGPDCYWKDPKDTKTSGCTKYFGNAWWIPFPPTVVIRYDEGNIGVVRTMPELELYISQNSSEEIRRKRQIRMVLRSLEDQIVYWPYEHTKFIGSRRPIWSGQKYSAHTTVLYKSCQLRLKRRGTLIWEDLDLGSGFEVELVYSKEVVVDGSVIGLTEDIDLTTPLARFLAMNRELVPRPLSHLEAVLRRYRAFQMHECERKVNALSHRFLTAVYDQPREPTGLAESSIEFERDKRVRALMLGSETVFRVTYERLSEATKCEISTWWYIFWDDLWRRNNDTIKAMKKHATDFNPHYPTSIAYTPLPRAALEAFLTQRGLLNKKPKFGDFFHAGFLNKMYLRMNDILYRGSQAADIIHLGDDASELDMEEVDQLTQARPSTLGTGGGTDHDDASIRARPLYRWEGILGDKVSKRERHRATLLAKIGVWFGVTPLWRTGVPSRGLALDVRLDNGRYVLLRDEERAESIATWKSISANKVP